MVNNVCNKQKDQLLTRSGFVARLPPCVNIRAVAYQQKGIRQSIRFWSVTFKKPSW